MATSDSLRALLASPSDRRKLGPFLLEQSLGEGGFAPVWRASEVYDGSVLRTAAVKLFPIGKGNRHSTEIAEMRIQVVQEAQALCRVEHPNVVRFYSLIVDEAIGVLGLAMELVEGKPISERLREEKTLPTDAVIAMGIEMASALDAIHRAGVVHRDVKPANILDCMGVTKLIDFGISAAERLRVVNVVEPSPAIIEMDDLPIEIVPVPEARRSGSNTHMFGTHGYIDPACLSDAQESTPASDVYSLGVTLFECMSGRIPAAAAQADGGWDTNVIMGRVPPPALISFQPQAPEALSVLLAEMLDPIPSARPSADAVSTRLYLLRAELRGMSVGLPSENEGPFRGLAPFEARDRGVYFGRVSEVAASIEMLRSRGVVTLVGPSGSGKSSLARAGILPSLQDGGLGTWPRRWHMSICSPGVDARESVGEALGIEVGRWNMAAIVSLLRARARDHGIGQVLFVDQLEELVTLSDPASREWFGAFLGELSKSSVPGVRVLMTLRRDLLDSVLAVERLGRAITRGMVLVEPIGAVAWGEIIEQALHAYGYKLEDESLRQELVADLASESSAMPLFQFALAELWKRRDSTTRQITRQSLRELGGIGGALERHAQRSVEALPASSRPSVRPVLLALTTAQGTRRVLPPEALSHVAERADEVVKSLESARLLVRTESGITLAHDTLIRNWSQLRGWVEEARADRLLVEELEISAAQWIQDPEGVPLWQKRRLAAAWDLVHRQGYRVSKNAFTFVETSRRYDRRTRIMLGAAGVAAVLAAVTGTGLYLRAVGAEQQLTRSALAAEKTSRQEAERRTKEVEQAQARIDQLVRDLADSPKKEEILALQSSIRSEPTAPVERAVSATPATPRPKATVTAQPTTVAPAVPTEVRVQSSWQ